MIGWLFGFDVIREDALSIEDVSIESVTQAYQPHQMYTSNLDNIVVEGGNQFVSHVYRCLQEIRGTKYESLVSWLTKINEVSSFADCGVNAEGRFNVPASDMGCGLFNSDPIIGASVLIHEAVHAKRMRNGEFDYTYYAGEELLAFAKEAEFLRLHGYHGRAADRESSDGRHNEAYMSAEFLATQH